LERVSRIAGGALVLVLGLAAPAAGATAPVPNVAAMMLTATDVSGATVVSQGRVTKGGYLAAYQRTLKLATPYGRSAIVGVQSEGMVGRDSQQIATDLAVVQRVFRSKDGRVGFVAGIAAKVHVTAAAVRLSALRRPRIGDGAVEQPLSIDLGTAKTYESLLYLRVDRVLVLLVSVGAHPIAAADSAALGRLVVGHVRRQLVPVNLTAPTVSGTADLGQTLTASPGTWSNADVVFTYQWQRCDPSGQTCNDIDGEKQSTYGVVGADAGFTLRVVVTATDRFGAPTAESDVTALVPVPPPPAPPPPSP
jgi:hypothetical protein